MPTRAERAAERAAKLRSDREATDKAIAQQEAIVRREERKSRDKRRYRIGKLVDEAGLFAWSDTDLAAVMETLATLRAVHHPGAVLEGLLRDPEGLMVPGINGTADVSAKKRVVLRGESAE